MNVTVFGATGAIGSLTVNELLTNGHTVTAYARNPNKIPPEWGDQVRVIIGELSDADAIDRAVQDADVVVSALGPSLDRKATGMPLIDGTRHILDAMKRHGVTRYVGHGTPSVLDPQEKPTWQTKLVGFMGRTGLPTCSVTASRPATPSVSASRAVSGSRPESMKARRTAAAGTSAAAATASSMTPSRAPWRSSPVSNRRRNACSSAVAAPNSSASRAARRAVEPVPVVAARASSVASTAATSSRGSATGAASIPASVRQPVPRRLCRGSPASQAVAGSTSWGPALRRRAASVAVFAVRERVAPTAAEAETTSASSTDPS